jgi:DNA-binding NtrC family response regulator
MSRYGLNLPEPGQDAGRRPAQQSLLVVGHPTGDIERLKQSLERHFALIEHVESPSRADRLLPRCHFDVIVIGIHSEADPALGWIARRIAEHPEGQPIFAVGKQENALADVCRRAGAADFLPQPLEVVALLERLPVRNAIPGPPPAPARRVAKGSGNDAMPELIGESEAICRVRELVQRIAPTPATVLIEGDTGTGKELVARLLHSRSRQRGLFVPVNCGAIPPDLMETELFGHAKGAFTGAHQLRDGLFVSARGGTLFLDEISEMRSDLQVKLLRALEEGAIRPVGADREIPIEVRIVASAQPGLLEKVSQGRFREDLYYRLNVVHIGLPRLSDRPEDVPALVGHFMARVARDFGMRPVSLDADSLARLRRRNWRGNVRELRNVVERTVLMGALPDMEPADPSEDSLAAGAYPLEWTLEQVKQAHILRVLKATGGNRSAAARQLGVSRKTLERKLGPAAGRQPGD